MKPSSVSDIRKELRTLGPEVLVDICMRLARYKKENKELLTYLLFDASDEQSYISSVKEVVDEYFIELPRGNTYYVKKSLRKILRFVNRQVKYSSIPQTELELRIHFCAKMKEAKIMMPEGTVLYNLYRQQVNKVRSIFEKLPEDIQGDYDREIRLLQ